MLTACAGEKLIAPRSGGRHAPSSTAYRTDGADSPLTIRTLWASVRTWSRSSWRSSARFGRIDTHPEQGFRSCLGILRLGKRYGEVRLEAACNRALRVRARSYRHVESILKNGLDRVATTDEQTTLSLTHENVRGRDYYH